MSQLWPYLCLFDPLGGKLNGTQSPLCFKSCMIGLLGGFSEQNEPTLAIFVLLVPIGGAELHSEPIMLQVMHYWLVGRSLGAKWANFGHICASWSQTH